MKIRATVQTHTRQKQFNSKAIKKSAAAMPLSLVYAMDNQEDKFRLLNNLVTNCLNEHAMLKRNKITNAPGTMVKRVEHQYTATTTK